MELRQTLDGMGDTPEARAIREKLDFIFPKPQESETAAT